GRGDLLRVGRAALTRLVGRRRRALPDDHVPGGHALRRPRDRQARAGAEPMTLARAVNFEMPPVTWSQKIPRAPAQGPTRRYFFTPASFRAVCPQRRTLMGARGPRPFTDEERAARGTRLRHRGRYTSDSLKRVWSRRAAFLQKLGEQMIREGARAKPVKGRVHGV